METDINLRNTEAYRNADVSLLFMHIPNITLPCTSQLHPQNLPATIARFNNKGKKLIILVKHFPNFDCVPARYFNVFNRIIFLCVLKLKRKQNNI